MAETDGCGAQVTLPDDETVTCSLHKLGWHTARTRATWPELYDEGEVCGAWGVTDTAEGELFVMCGKVPDHGTSKHYAEVAGFPKQWH